MNPASAPADVRLVSMGIRIYYLQHELELMLNSVRPFNVTLSCELTAHLGYIMSLKMFFSADCLLERCIQLVFNFSCNPNHTMWYILHILFIDM